jgi:hypothetical protein
MDAVVAHFLPTGLPRRRVAIIGRQAHGSVTDRTVRSRPANALAGALSRARRPLLRSTSVGWCLSWTSNRTSRISKPHTY